MIGYREERARIQLEPGQRLRHDFYLKPEPLRMQEVNVTAERARFEHEVDIGVQHIDIQQLRQLPSFGEADLFRSLELLPGVVSVSDYSSALYIRGGTPDQNHILLDGITLYNPYHLLGVFSTFIVDGLKDAELHTGGYPARYGEAISSVLDVRMRDGNTERFGCSGELGLVSSRLVVEGPLPFGNGSWIVAGRRTYLDVVTKAIDETFDMDSSSLTSLVSDLLDYIGADHASFYVPYHFYDLQTRVSFDAGEHSRFILSCFVGDDVFDYKDERASTALYRWGNAALGLQWRCVATPKLLFVAKLNTSQYRVRGLWKSPYEISFEDTIWNRSEIGADINTVSENWEFSWYPNTSNTLSWGTDAKVMGVCRRSLETSFEEFFFQPVPVMIEKVYADASWLAGLYVDHKWEPTAMWVFETGLRGEYFDRGDYLRVSPRLGIKRRLTSDWAVKAGSGMYYQYLFVPYPEDEMALRVPIQFIQSWTMVNNEHPPLQATLFTLGTEYLFPKHGEVSMESYYKDLRNISEWESVEPGRGYSYGVELMFKYRSSWLGYSYSVTRYRFDGEWFYPLNDSRHNVNIAFVLPFKKGWEFTAAWVYGSGFPYTGLAGWQQYVDPDGIKYWFAILGQRGMNRYPAYHRLDVGVKKHLKLFKRLNGSVYVQVLNVYARHNVLDYYFGMNYNSGVTYKEPIYMLPLPVPSIGFKVEF
jgi:hypothetical protein